MIIHETHAKFETHTIHMGPEWDSMMLMIEEHADPTQGLMLTGLELDWMEELHRRVGQLMDIGIMYGREREEVLRRKVAARQDEWTVALKEAMQLCAF